MNTDNHKRRDGSGTAYKAFPYLYWLEVLKDSGSVENKNRCVYRLQEYDYKTGKNRCK